MVEPKTWTLTLWTPKCMLQGLFSEHIPDLSACAHRRGLCVSICCHLQRLVPERPWESHHRFSKIFRKKKKKKGLLKSTLTSQQNQKLRAEAWEKRQNLSFLICNRAIPLCIRQSSWLANMHHPDITQHREGTSFYLLDACESLIKRNILLGIFVWQILTLCCKRTDCVGTL